MMWRLMSLLLLGGILGGLSVSVPYLWPLAILSFAILCRVLFADKRSLKESFLYGWWFGCALMGTTSHWIFNALPLDWAGISDKVSAFVIVSAVWFSISVILGMSVGLWAVSVKYFRTNRMTDFILVPLLWVVFEWVRMWMSTLFTWGSGSILAPYFSFGMLGFALGASDALLSIARIGGVYILSFVAAFLGFFVWKYGQVEGVDQKIRYFRGSVFIAIVYLILILHPFVPPPSSLTIQTLSVDFPSKLTFTKEDALERLFIIEEKLRQLAHTQPDIVVLPESMRLIQTLEAHKKDPRMFLESIFGIHETLIIDTRRVEDETGTLGEVVFFSSTRGEIGSRQKLILIPFGEYVPYAFAFGMRLFGMDTEVERVIANRSYESGGMPRLVHFRDMDLAVLVCSEMLSPNLYKYVGMRSENLVLLNASSQAIFHGAKNPFYQLSLMARVHSAWSNAPYFQSTNGGEEVRVVGK